MQVKLNKKSLLFGLFVVFNILGWEINNHFSYLSIFCFLIYLIFSNYKENVYLIYFLIPNIRIYDNLGFQNYVNIIIYIIGFLYLLQSNKLSKKELFMPIILFVFEFLHIILYIGNTSFYDEIIANITFIWNMIIFLVLLKNINSISFNKINENLILGLLISIFIKIFSYGTNFVDYFLNTNDRFAAYSGDPNYFSMYILIAITYLLFYAQQKNYFELIVLSIVGVFSASKMFLIVFSLLCVLYFIRNAKYKRFLLQGIPLIIVVLCGLYYLFGDVLLSLIDKILLRFISETDNTISLSKMTTGRYELLLYYLNLLFNNISMFLFGMGLRYNRILNHLVAHNTYIDILVSWGLPMGIGFLVYLIKIIKKHVRIFEFYQFIHFFIFCLIIFSLSSFTADMFYYLLFLVVGSMKEGRREHV